MLRILNNTLAWFVVSVFLLAIAFIASFRFRKNTQAFLNRLEELTNQSSKDLKQLIDEKISPRIQLHDNEISVARRAADLIREAADEPNPSDRFITFYGAASMAATADEVAANDQSEDNEESPSMIYRDAIAYASRNRVRMRRYINLFSKDEVTTRHQRIQRQYLTWLSRQLALLSTDEQYQLTVVVRAPQWGTNMARILTRRIVMEITGNGKAAVVVEDRRIAERVRTYAREAILGSNPKIKPRSYGISADAEPVERFQEYVEDIKTAVRTSR